MILLSATAHTCKFTSKIYQDTSTRGDWDSFLCRHYGFQMINLTDICNVDVNVLLRMNCNNFGDALTFPQVPPQG